MSTKNTPQTVNEKIATYFDRNISFEDFAQQIRRANYILSNVIMQPNAEQNIACSYWINDCFFYLNEFAELLDPVLNKDLLATNQGLKNIVSNER